ncbi:MAG: 50S ribosomal protein L14e [Thermoplasmatota archaeon]|jgi:large subunit ribosomal protein L14e
MMEVGRLCMKIAGRDAGKYGIITDIINEKFVMLDGQVRRRKVNINHIEPLPKVLNIKKNASHEEVVEALKGIGIVVEKKVVEKKTEKSSAKEEAEEEKPVKTRKKKSTENKK